jgi:peptidoglycan/LPS O-acetylase OafA/YrhL
MGGRSRRVFDTMDGLRAAGAQLVVMRHLPEFFGGFRVPESFLAVDLFYLVSGVVLANAYGERLKARAMGLKAFTVTRLIRLYPLYLLGLGLGVADALLNMAHDPNSWWTPLKLAEAIGTGLLMIPLFPGLDANGTSLNGPTWTLVPEIVANLVWAGTIRWVRALVVPAMLLVCGAGVVLAEQRWGTLDVGYGPDQLWGGLARAGYSFFMGVAVYRLVGGRRIDARIVPWLLVAALTLVLAWRPREDDTTPFELSAVLVGLPVLVTLAALFEPGPRVAQMFSTVGRASWGVYILHEPVARLLKETVRRGWRPAAGIEAALTGGALLVVLSALAWGLDRWFEAPVRKTLTARLAPKPPAPTGPVQSASKR